MSEEQKKIETFDKTPYLDKKLPPNFKRTFIKFQKIIKPTEKDINRRITKKAKRVVLDKYSPISIDSPRASSPLPIDGIRGTISRQSSNEISVENSPIVDERCLIEKPCEKIKDVDNKIAILTDEKRMLQECCNHIKYWSDRNQPKTLMELLHRIVSKQIKSCDSLFEKFPESGERTNTLLTKAYIFEALWKIIFLLNLDNISPEFKRDFKVNIEQNQSISVFDYLTRPINEGNRAGVCDLYFTVERDKDPPEKKVNNACEEEYTPNVGDAYLFTSKYYKKEKGLGKYDYEKIITEAIEKYRPSHKADVEGRSDTFRIITLINNKDEFIRSLRRNTDRAVKKYVFSESDVYGYDDLNLVYYKKLYQWLKTNFDTLEQIEDESTWKKALKARIEPNISDILRFHQQYFVDYTCDLLKGKTSGKIIWGAVARSGKSIMIGGLVAKRKPDVVILLLGAVGETKEQFVKELFNKYTDLKDGYDVIDTQNSPKKIAYTGSKSVVIVISQEKLRGDVAKSTDFIQSLDPFLKQKNKMIFFDEIHQGGSESSMQRETLEYFYKPEFPEPILIMVTATYAKPMIKYSEGLGSSSAYLIAWSYDMIMKMKSFSKMMVSKDDSEYEKLIDSQDPEYLRKMAVLYNITDLYNRSGKSDETIAAEYSIYPELKYLIPTIETPKTTIGEGDGKIVLSNNENIKKLWEINGDKLKYESSMMDYLDYIYNTVYGKLLHDQFHFVANGGGQTQTHSQLWFLPTQLRKDDSNNPSDDKDDSVFEIVSRRLAECIISNNKFKNFDVCVVHSIAKKSIKDVNGINRIFFECVTAKSIKDCIKTREINANAAGRSLIILTGKRLRLGISLPCVDVAIHMDPIQSYDIIYQSMFRVLTERRGKTRGYFVDMLADRAVNFIYNYTIQAKPEVQGNINKEDVRNSLLLFDVNGIKEKMFFEDNSIVKNSYDKIAQEFGIDSQNSMKFDKILNEQHLSVNAKGFINIIKGLLSDKKIGDELKRIISKSHVFGEKTKTKSKGKAYKHVAVVHNPSITYGDVNSTQVENTSTNIQAQQPVIDNKIALELKINAIYKTIENSFTLFIWFSDGTKTIQDLLSNNVALDYDKIRNCEDDHVIYHCYLALNSQDISISNLEQTDLHTLKERVDEQLDLLRSIYTLDSADIKDSINNIYSDIKSVMKSLGGKLKEEKEKFRITDSRFCPKDFIDNENVLEIIRKHLTPKEKEKNLFGEVFTPLELVCEMLSKLPNSVWTDKNMKWFDPANGIGNFPIVVYYKLMVTLKSVIGNSKKRSNHIIEQMLYMNELNPINVSVCRRIFKMIDPDATPNIFKGDFLEKSEFGGVSKFDIIIGNPPFQKGQNSNFYVEFIKKSITISPKFLLFIIPNRILIPDHPANTEIVKFNPFYVHQNVNAYFDIGTTTCFFIADNKPYQHKTRIKYLNGTIITDLLTPTPTEENDVNIKILSDKILLTDIPKLIFYNKQPDNKKHMFIKRQWTRFSPNKPNGGGSHIFQIVKEKEKQNDGKFIEITDNMEWYLTRSKVIRFITKIYASSMNVPPFLWKTIPKLSSTTDEDVYKKLNLTKNDINLIETTLGDSGMVEQVEILSKLRGHQTRKKHKKGGISRKSRKTTGLFGFL